MTNIIAKPYIVSKRAISLPKCRQYNHHGFVGYFLCQQLKSSDFGTTYKLKWHGLMVHSRACWSTVGSMMSHVSPRVLNLSFVHLSNLSQRIDRLKTVNKHSRQRSVWNSHISLLLTFGVKCESTARQHGKLREKHSQNLETYSAMNAMTKGI